MQTAACLRAPLNKKQYIQEIGRELVASYGKKKFYKPEEVRKCHRKKKGDASLELEEDFSCRAMSIFTSHEAFDKYHQSGGETCNYVEMRQEMLSGSDSSFWEDLISMPDFDWDGSWIDLTAAVSTVSESVGSFLSGLTDLLDS